MTLKYAYYVAHIIILGHKVKSCYDSKQSTASSMV
jgi:hypothetical protein